MVVIPDVMGLCLYGPLIDKFGNSVKGVAFCKVNNKNNNHDLVIFLHTYTTEIGRYLSLSYLRQK